MSKMRADFAKILISIAAVLVIFSFTSTAALAIGLQVSPISIDLPDNANATELWLINTSDKPMQAQVRVYQWEQKNKKDILTATSNLIVSPPVAKIAANGRQLVRVIRKKVDEITPLSTFRILINEMPATTNKDAGVDFVMEYSIPVFVYSEKLDSMHAVLELGISASGKTTMLRANNTGGLYSRLYAMAFIDSKGNRHVLNSGLVGYVLPHQEMQWDIGKPPIAFAKGGTIEVLLNGKTHSQTLAPLGP